MVKKKAKRTGKPIVEAYLERIGQKVVLGLSYNNFSKKEPMFLLIH